MFPAGIWELEIADVLFYDVGEAVRALPLGHVGTLCVHHWRTGHRQYGQGRWPAVDNGDTKMVVRVMKDMKQGLIWFRNVRQCCDKSGFLLFTCGPEKFGWSCVCFLVFFRTTKYMFDVYIATTIRYSLFYNTQCNSTSKKVIYSCLTHCDFSRAPCSPKINERNFYPISIDYSSHDTTYISFTKCVTSAAVYISVD